MTRGMSVSIVTATSATAWSFSSSGWHSCWRSCPSRWKFWGVEMDVIRDVLDKQLIDRNNQKMGKVDGIVMVLREGERPRIAYIEVGAVALARRLHPRLAER